MRLQVLQQRMAGNKDAAKDFKLKVSQCRSLCRLSMQQIPTHCCWKLSWSYSSSHPCARALASLLHPRHELMSAELPIGLTSVFTLCDLYDCLSEGAGAGVHVAGQDQGHRKAVPRLWHGHGEDGGLQQDGVRQLRWLLVLEVSMHLARLACPEHNRRWRHACHILS